MQHHFQGHFAIEPKVTGVVHDTHPAASQLSQDFVARNTGKRDRLCSGTAGPQPDRAGHLLYSRGHGAGGGGHGPSSNRDVPCEQDSARVSATRSSFATRERAGSAVPLPAAVSSGTEPGSLIDVGTKNVTGGLQIHCGGSAVRWPANRSIY